MAQPPTDAELLELLSQLTTSEKISLLAGKNSWETQNIDRLNIPSLKVRVVQPWPSPPKLADGVFRSAMAPTEPEAPIFSTAGLRHVSLPVCRWRLPLTASLRGELALPWPKRPRPRGPMSSWVPLCAHTARRLADAISSLFPKTLSSLASSLLSTFWAYRARGWGRQ